MSFTACLCLDNAAHYGRLGRPVYFLSGFDTHAAVNSISPNSTLWRAIHDYTNSRSDEETAFAFFFLLHDSAYLIFYASVVGVLLKLLIRIPTARYES